MTLASKITILRILAIPIFITVNFFPQIKHHNIVSASIFLAIALTDLLDGYLARKMNEVTRIGKFLDPLADKLLVITALIVLIQLGRTTVGPVVVIIGREFIISGLRLLAQVQGKPISASALGKAKTFVQNTAIVILLLNIPIFNLQYGRVAIWVAALFSVVSGVEIFIKNKDVIARYW